jgi:hypothetical protein
VALGLFRGDTTAAGVAVALGDTIGAGEGVETEAVGSDEGARGVEDSTAAVDLGDVTAGGTAAEVARGDVTWVGLGCGGLAAGMLRVSSSNKLDRTEVDFGGFGAAEEKISSSSNNEAAFFDEDARTTGEGELLGTVAVAVGVEG